MITTTSQLQLESLIGQEHHADSVTAQQIKDLQKQIIDLQGVQTHDTQLSTEQVQDIVGGMFSSNTETRITATYQDSDGTIDLVVDDQSSDNNTTYDLAAGSSSGNATITLSGSDSSSDVVTLSAGGGIVYNVIGNDIAITSKNNLVDLDDTNYSGTPSNNDILKWSSSGGVGGSGAWILGSQSSSTNNYADSLSFNTGNGILTVGRSGLTDLTVDLDGRYTTGTIPTNNNQLTNGAGYITSAPTNNNQLTNGAGYITSSGTAANANNVKIRTDNDAAWHYPLFVDSNSDNQNQTLKVDASGMKYYPSAGWLQNIALQSYYMYDWAASAGSAGQVLTSQGSSNQWSWTTPFSGSYNDLSSKPTIPTNNNQLTNGAGYITSAANYQRFTSSGTWSKPSSGSVAIVYMWGGGGGGGNGQSYKGGGGGGSYAQFVIPMVYLSSSESVTVGSGGGQNSNGGTSQFKNSDYQACGGSHGVSGNYSNQGGNGGQGGTVWATGGGATGGRGEDGTNIAPQNGSGGSGGGGGAGGWTGHQPGGHAWIAGAGGGGRKNNSSQVGGQSKGGGNGGQGTGSNGTAPGGGGGGGGGSGGRGEVIVVVV